MSPNVNAASIGFNGLGHHLKNGNAQGLPESSPGDLDEFDIISNRNKMQTSPLPMNSGTNGESHEKKAQSLSKVKQYRTEDLMNYLYICIILYFISSLSYISRITYSFYIDIFRLGSLARRIA